MYFSYSGWRATHASARMCRMPPPKKKIGKTELVKNSLKLYLHTWVLCASQSFDVIFTRVQSIWKQIIAVGQCLVCMISYSLMSFPSIWFPAQHPGALRGAPASHQHTAAAGRKEQEARRASDSQRWGDQRAGRGRDDFGRRPGPPAPVAGPLGDAESWLHHVAARQPTGKGRLRLPHHVHTWLDYNLFGIIFLNSLFYIRNIDLFYLVLFKWCFYIYLSCICNQCFSLFKFTWKLLFIFNHDNISII